MSEKMIEINGKFVRQPHVDLLDRGRVKKLKPLLKELSEDEDMDLLYELVGFMIPEVTQKDLDSLILGDVKHILSAAGIAKFEEIGTDPARISLGESSASTNS